MDIAVIGRPSSVTFTTRSEFERSGTYVFEIDAVLFGALVPAAVELGFNAQEDAVGHVYGNDLPRGRTIVYLRRSGEDQFDVVRTFPC